MNVTKKSSVWSWTAFIMLLSFMFMLPLSQMRLIARDEGFYVMASSLVFEGKLPSIDFFYPQMPLLPYVYGAWLKLWGTSWESARALSAVLTSISCGLLFLYVSRIAGRASGVIATACFILSTLVFAEFTIVKTYALTNFLLLLCLVLWQSSRLWWAGFILGLAVDSRLPIIGIAPIFFALIFLRREVFSNNLKQAFIFGFGIGVALLPNLILLCADFDSYYFNNFGYHLERTGHDEETLAVNKWLVASALIGLRAGKQFGIFQFPILLHLTLLYGIWCAYKRRLPDISFWIGLILVPIHLSPEPTYFQYFSVCIPFFIVCAVLFLKNFFYFFWGRKFRSVAVLVPSLCAFFYFFHVPEDLQRYTSSGSGVIGVKQPEAVENATISTLSDITAAIDTVTKPGDVVLTLWPGYLFGSHARPYPGLENHFGYIHARKGRLSTRELIKYHIVSPKMVVKAIENHAATLVIKTDRQRFMQTAIKAGGYEQFQEVGGVKLYK